jgi:hypothetical protein
MEFEIREIAFERMDAYSTRLAGLPWRIHCQVYLPNQKINFLTIFSLGELTAKFIYQIQPTVHFESLHNNLI